MNRNFLHGGLDLPSGSGSSCQDSSLVGDRASYFEPCENVPTSSSETLTSIELDQMVPWQHKNSYSPLELEHLSVISTTVENSVDPSASEAQAATHTLFSETIPSSSSSKTTAGLVTSKVEHTCACISCTLRSIGSIYYRFDSSQACPLNCGYDTDYRHEFKNHWLRHFKHDDNKYYCKGPGCKQSFKKWGDLKRHDKGHCKKPNLFPCEVIGCKYGGKNGFIRKDKLYSHRRNVHDGKLVRIERNRTLQAKLVV